MESTQRIRRPRAKWLAAATATLLLLSLLPFAGAVGAVVVGDPAKLAFTQQPGAGSAGTGGIAWVAGKQPVVEVQDSGGTKVGTDSGRVVTLSITAGPAGATLSCTSGTSVTVSTGVATFSGCAIDKAGTGYVLTATSAPSLTSASSTAFDIAVGDPAKLVFQQQPVGPYDIAEAFAAGNQPWVAITDAGGNVVTASVLSVALTLPTPPIGGPGVLACDQASNTVAAASGVAKFTGCKINTNSGAGYKLHATAGALTAGDSAAFNVKSGTPTKLAFKVQPAGGTGGLVWVPQPVVQVLDVLGNVAAQDSSTVVTLAITTSPVTGATLTCTGGLSKVVTNGQATFADCKIDKAAVGYRITATDTTGSGGAHPYTSVQSDLFTVAVGPAAQLGFTAEPGASAAGAPFTIQPVVAIQDAGGNTVTTAPVTTVTLVFGANPGGGILACTSGVSRSTASGVATFSGCAISAPGTGYKLAATASGLPSVAGTAFNVTSAPALITLTASAGIVNQLQPLLLTVQLGSSGASRLVTLEKKNALDSGWVTVALLTTDLAGKATASVTPTNTASYRVSFAGATDLSPGTSNVVSVSVRYVVTMAPKTATGSSTVARGTARTYTATVRPLYPTQRISFQVYKWVGGAWVFQTSATKTADASGKASFTWTWSKSGKWYMRARANSTPMNSTAFSNLEKVTVP